MATPSGGPKNSTAELAEKYHDSLLAGAGGAETYLAERGINRRAVERFQLGWSGETDRRSTSNRLVIPYLHPRGVWHLKYRCTTDHDHKADRCPKYTYDDGAEQHLYNAQTLLKAESVVVVEGELDAISVEMCGIAAVAFPGADTWKKNRHWRWCFDSVTDITVVADGDDPAKNTRNPLMGVGEEAARAVADSLRQSLPDVTVRTAVLPIGEDSNSYIHKHGQVEYLDRIGML